MFSQKRIRKTKKRLCFDTESNYFKRFGSGIGAIEYHREVMQKFGPIRFDCAVVFDEESRRYFEFPGTQIAEFVALLATADELLSHSGKRHDLLILEQVCGFEAIAPIWNIPHHDLMEAHNWTSLDNLSRQYIPNRIPLLEEAWMARLQQADETYPGTPWGSGFLHPPEHFIERKLAKARHDVERTYGVFVAVKRGLPPTLPESAFILRGGSF